MSETELQEEEREVLSSIYDGDDSFKQIDPIVYQYKVSFLIVHSEFSDCKMKN